MRSHAAPISRKSRLRGVVGDEQRTLPRDVRFADRADAVNRVGEEPEHETDEELRQQLHHVERSADRDQGAGENHLRGREAREAREQPGKPGRDEHRGEREHVRERDEPALHALGASLLEERVERHDEEAGSEAPLARQ